MVRRPARIAAAAAVLALGAGACGSTHHPATHLAAASATKTTRAAALNPTEVQDYSVTRSAIVTMRAYSPESLLWQIVSVSRTGHGLLTTLIGEVAGARRTPFVLPPAQAARLRDLVAAGRTVHAPPPINARAELYTLHIAGEPAINFQGRLPHRVAPLVHFLSGLMLTYCC